MNRSIVSVLFLAACNSGGEPAPSCQQALEHYYEAGCVYVDLQTGEEIPVGEFVLTCREAYQSAPDSCIDDLDAWLICNASVPNPATTGADCDCSVEQEALARCG